MELSIEQIILLGVVATVVVQGVKLLIVWFKATPIPKDTLEKILYAVTFVISVILAFLWLKPAIDLGGDPAQMAKTLIDMAAGVFGFALIIYKFLLKAIMDKLGWNVEKVQSLKLPKEEQDG